MSHIDTELEEALKDAEAASARHEEDLPALESRVAGGAPRVRTRRNVGLLLGLLAVAGGALALVFVGVDGAAIYSVSTEQLLENKEQYAGRTVRVEGDLVKGSLRYRAEPCEYRFNMERGGKVLAVRYPECIVPDTFRDVPDMDVQVTAEGTLTDEGYLDASHIMAKCPSKYEMQQKAAQGEAAPHQAMGMPVTAPPIEE